MKYKTHIYKTVTFRKNHKSKETIESVLREEAEFTIPDLLPEEFPVVMSLTESSPLGNKSKTKLIRSDGKDLFIECNDESIEPEVTKMFETASCGEIGNDGKVKFFVDGDESEFLMIRDGDGNKMKASLVCDLQVSDNGTSQRYQRHFHDFVRLNGKYWQRISAVPCYEVTSTINSADVSVKHKRIKNISRNVYRTGEQVEMVQENAAVFPPDKFYEAIAYANNYGIVMNPDRLPRIRVLNQDVVDRLWKCT